MIIHYIHFTVREPETDLFGNDFPRKKKRKKVAVRSHIQAASEGRDFRGHTPNADDHRNVPGLWICHITVATTWLKTFAIYPRGKLTQRAKKKMALIEIDGVYLLIAWWIFPWFTYEKWWIFPVRYGKLPCRVCDLPWLLKTHSPMG